MSPIPTNVDRPLNRRPRDNHERGEQRQREHQANQMLISPAPHELTAHLHFRNGLGPWYALHDRLGIDAATTIDKVGRIPEVEREFTYNDRRWTTTLRPKSSGLTPDQVDPTLTSIPEFVVEITPAYTGSAPPRAVFTISPRTPDTPGPSWTGIDVEVSGSNLAAAVYPQLLYAATCALGIDNDSEESPSYFDPDDMANSSNIVRFEHYVRVRRSTANALYGDDGPIRRISQLLATTHNYRRVEEDGRDERSYYGTVGFDTAGAKTLIDDHRLGKVIKLYDAATPPKDPDHPLHHPKLCVRYKRQHTDTSVYWSDLHDVKHELTETLINLLHWSGITPVAMDDTVDRAPFVADEHFDPTVGNRITTSVAHIEDPLPLIRRQQTDSVQTVLTESTPTQRDVLQVMVDGGHMTEPEGPGIHYEMLADRAGVSVATVYRVLEQLDDLAINTTGRIKLASYMIVDSIRSKLSSWGSDAESDINTSDGSPTGSNPDLSSDEASSTAGLTPWEEWVATHGVTTEHDHERVAEEGPRKGAAQWIIVDLGELPPGMNVADLRSHVEDGFAAWTASNRPKGSYCGARFRWRECGADEPDECEGKALRYVQLEPDRRDSEPQLKSARR